MDDPSDPTVHPFEHNPIPLDNSGHGSLRVPGFGGIPIYYELQSDARFAHCMREWRQAHAVTARESAMVAVMNNLTDHAEWHVEIFNDEVVARWRKEAFDTTPLMSEKAWSWCLQELRDKADYFREYQHVRVLDTGSCVCESDMPTLCSLGAIFRAEASALLGQQQRLSQQGDQRDLHPQSDQVLDLVDPLLFPLVYSRSLVLADGGQVDLHNIFSSYQNAKVAPKHFDRRVDSLDLQKMLEKWEFASVGIHPHSDPKIYRWSSNYQSLPCEVEFLKDSDTEVQITSYINNLHPAHRSLYCAIEKLIFLAIKPWNDCLVRGQPGWKDFFNLGQLGPVPLRIITYGIEWENELPQRALAFRVPPTIRKRWYRKAKEELESTMGDETDDGRRRHLKAQQRLCSLRDVAGKEDMELPPPDSELWQMAKQYLELPENGSNSPAKLPDDWATGGEECTWRLLTAKVDRILRFKHPGPGTAFSYEDWKAGRHNDKAIVDLVRERADCDWSASGYGPVIPAHRSYMINLQETFRKQGLQVIVKMDSIELTQENPTYSSGSWQIYGHLNEHIVAVVAFAYDVENVTEPRIAFRQHTSLQGCFYQYDELLHTGQDMDPRIQPAHRYGKSAGIEVSILGQILGIPDTDLLADDFSLRSFQGAGSVATRQGRLTTFPSVLEHRVEPFTLVDPSTPGHCRWIKIYLVDPHYRVCSTRNVPPQQHDWWAQAVGNDLQARVPREIVDGILQATDGWPMGLQEARQHRHELIKEHRGNKMTLWGTMPGPSC